MTWTNNLTAWMFALLLVLPAALPPATEALPAAADSTDRADRVIDPEAAREKVAAAREAAAGDRHHQAVADYLDALANDATLVPTVAQEIAYQKLWREDAEQSIFYFRRYLARHPGQENRSVRQGLALAYSWSGRQQQAIGLYRELVSEDPTDGGTRVGLGRSLIWDNRLHEGFVVLRGVEDSFTPDTAPGRESRDFLLTVLDGYTPHLELRVDQSWDSDDLDITKVSATGSLTVLGNKLLQVLPSWALYRQPGQADITNLRPAVGIVAPLARNWTLHAYGWADRFRSDAPLFGGSEKLAWNRVGGDFWFTWIAKPRLRLDFGGTSMPVETFEALSRGIGYKQANVSADWRFARSFSLGLSGKLADYSDGNEKRQGLARLTWRREGRWEFFVGPVFNYMDFALAYPGGYWSPDWVRNGSMAATAKTRTGRMTFTVNASYGYEKESGADGIAVGGASGRVGWRFAAGWLAALEGGYSKSSFATASGYSRTFASLAVRAMF